MPSSHKRPSASPLSMEGLSVRSSPRFVSDILLVCEPTEEDFYSGKRARLTSLLDPANGQRSVVETKEDGRYRFAFLWGKACTVVEATLAKFQTLVGKCS